MLRGRMQTGAKREASWLLALGEGDLAKQPRALGLGSEASCVMVLGPHAPIFQKPPQLSCPLACPPPTHLICPPAPSEASCPTLTCGPA